MTDKLTANELVKLATFCGREVFLIGDILWVGRNANHVAAQWNPAEDANQRDEVVEAMRLSNTRLHLWSNPHSSTPYSCVLGADWETRSNHQATPGLAVCRAALQVIAETEKANAD